MMGARASGHGSRERMMVKSEMTGRRALPALLAFSLAVVGWAAAHGPKDWPVPAEAKKLKNPVRPTAAAQASAKSIYLDKCAQCHGEEGRGDGPESVMYAVKPANFTEAHMMREMSDGEIFWKISEGRAPMPTFKKQLTEEQRWQLVHYVRAFAPSHRSPNAPARQKTPAHKH